MLIGTLKIVGLTLFFVSCVVAEDPTTSLPLTSEEIVSSIEALGTSPADSVSAKSTARNSRKLNFSGRWRGKGSLSENNCGLDLGELGERVTSDHRVVHKGSKVTLTALPSGDSMIGKTSGRSSFAVSKSDTVSDCSRVVGINYAKITSSSANFKAYVNMTCGSVVCRIAYTGKTRKR